jgi:O-antigen ligase
MKTILFLASVVLGFYGPDMHKLFLTVVAFLSGTPLAFEDYGRLADIIVGSIILGLFLAVVLLNKRSIRYLLNVPTGLMVVLALLMTISLMQSSDEISMENYLRFMGGNLLVFFGALVFCRTPEAIKRIWDIWVITGIILALISIYLFRAGIVWNAERSLLFPGTAIRGGYFCGLSVIYLTAGLIFEDKHKHLFLRLGVIALCLAGVLLSGSKFSFLLVIGFLMIAYGAKLVLTKKVNLVPIVLSFITVMSVSVIIFDSLIGMESQGLGTGKVGEIHNADIYNRAAVERLDLDKDYLELGMKNLFFGNGIAAAYALKERTHSVLVALFVQVGLSGVAIYLLFLFIIVSKGFNIMKQMGSRDMQAGLFVSSFLAVIFLALKAEVTGDIPANRELWLFCGMLLALESAVTPLKDLQSRRLAGHNHLVPRAAAGVTNHGVAAAGTIRRHRLLGPEVTPLPGGKP